MGKQRPEHENRFYTSTKKLEVDLYREVWKNVVYYERGKLYE